MTASTTECVASEQEITKSISVEIVLEKLGGYSRFQLLATVILLLPEVTSSMIAMSPILCTNVGSYCLLDNNVTHIMTKENMCNLMSICFESNFTLLNSSISINSIVEEWTLYCDRAWIVETLTSAQMFGTTIGALVFPQLADTFGRKKILYVICILMGTSGCVSALALSPLMYAILRLVSGLATGGLYFVALNFLMEFLTPPYRTICGCVSLWGIGEMLLAITGWFFPNWRKLLFVISLPVLVLTILFSWIPESPRWLLCKGRTEDAAKVFNQIAKWNNRPEISYEEVQSLQQEILKQHTPTPSDSNSKNTNCIKKLKMVKDLSNTTYRTQLLVMVFSWFALSLAYYGLSFHTKNLGEDPYLNILFLGASELPGPFSGLLFNNRFGRKRTLIGYVGMGALILTVVAAVEAVPIFEISDMDLGPHVTVALILLGRYFIATAYAVLACCTIESFPTGARGTYTGICGFAGNIGSILAPQLVFLGTMWPFTPYVCFCILTSLVAFSFMWLKETNGNPLKDDL